IFSEPLYGSTYTSVNFVIIDTSTNSNTVFYSYKATGTAPTSETVLQWDNTEPTRYYLWTPNDTICVAFNAVAGGRLDSIRVALKRAGSITGGIWTYTGGPSSSNPSPLGTALASINASISDSATYPYMIPYNNWSTVDLRTSNISTNNPFAVGFVIGRNPSAPGIMSTDYPGQDAYHSYTYLQTAESAPGPPGWYYIASSDTTVAIYLIRAYVSLITGVKQEIELTPKTFSLSQNYPNPFNPSTIINFAVPKAGKVRIAVYNQLGQQVALIADKEYSPGSYSINFNGASLASGIYFYRIETGSFTQTKKMVLLK
ncbi:MAG: T9SS type A sorting domain-containing protein, partial [Ignavibacteriaceae bacterium]